MAKYEEKLCEIQEIPAPDELIAGGMSEIAPIVIKTAGKYVRGQVMMSGDDGYVSATSSGISGAKDVCILAEGVELEEGYEVSRAGYFTGRFRASSLVLGYEQEGDDHSSLIEAITGTLRQHNIYVEE